MIAWSDLVLKINFLARLATEIALSTLSRLRATESIMDFTSRAQLFLFFRASLGPLPIPYPVFSATDS